MGRRALRKIDPDLDLSHHLWEWDELPSPGSTDALFGRQAPLEVEIGTGKGLFLQQAAQDCAEHDFFGIEIVGKYARFAAARLAKRSLDNARVLHGDGLRFFREWLPEDELRAVHVYFPDPWWKKRHRKRRVMNAAFLRDVQRTLEPGGTLHFWSDVAEYFEATLEIIAAETTLDGPQEEPVDPPQHDLDYRTHFERRMRLHGEPVYRARFEKS